MQYKTIQVQTHYQKLSFKSFTLVVFIADFFFYWIASYIVQMLLFLCPLLLCVFIKSLFYCMYLSRRIKSSHKTHTTLSVTCGRSSRWNSLSKTVCASCTTWRSSWRPRLRLCSAGSQLWPRLSTGGTARTTPAPSAASVRRANRQNTRWDEEGVQPKPKHIDWCRPGTK